jgi:hypothetical protein
VVPGPRFEPITSELCESDGLIFESVGLGKFIVTKHMVSCDTCDSQVVTRGHSGRVLEATNVVPTYEV